MMNNSSETRSRTIYYASDTQFRLPCRAQQFRLITSTWMPFIRLFLVSIENELEIFWPWWADNLICIKTHFHARVLCPPFPLNKYSAEILVCLHFAFATMSFRIFIALSMLCINWKWHKTDTEESSTTRTKQWNIQLEKNFRIVVVHPTTWIESWWYDQTWYYNIPHFHLSACIICAWQVVYWLIHTTLERAVAL